MTEPRELERGADPFITLSDKIGYAQFFLVSGLLLFFPSLMGGTWTWWALAALFFLVAVWSGFQWWILHRRWKSLGAPGPL
jgi:hypothetical protein